ncbi:MAG: UDP-N-acetylmuramoyl-L-alanine--D-glutamate ligase [Verrucomicrobia bacterium]|nr:UDP-N-acetylmuramoyl-L-alanine--D-glutamate ligase [Verrucomicrobiota bacterium]
MHALANKNILVIGLGASGRAACELLRQRGAQVTAIDAARTDVLTGVADQLTALGVKVQLAASGLPADMFDLAVISPGVPLDSPFVRELANRRVPLIGELELGYQQSLCLNVAITGTNGKTTTTELVERMLTQAHRQTIAAGNIGLPVCAIAERTKALDILTLEVSSFQLETIEFFRPAVAVLMNLTPDHLDRYATMTDYIRAKARIFMNQQPFDWAIIQSEALAQLRTLEISIPSKIVTFSAVNRRADIYLDRGLLISRLPDWSGPLLDMETCQLRGPHNAENLMAALAVGRVLRVPLEEMVAALQAYSPAPHRCERVAEVNGVAYVNDSKATNLDAVQKAIQAMPVAKSGEPNVWLIAGGKDKGFAFHDIGPLLSQRVKGAFLIGETREKMRAAWSLFTPCSPVGSLLEAVSEAARKAVSGDIVLLSPACSSFDMFQNYQDRGEVFRRAVACVAKNPNHPGGDRGNKAMADSRINDDDVNLANLRRCFREEKLAPKLTKTKTQLTDAQNVPTNS